MKILVIGGGGREHALVWKMSHSGHQIFCAPGNPGIAEIAECLPLQPLQIKELADFAKSNQIQLTVVGPEAPLTAGIVDVFEKQGLVIFGPNKQAALLEGSKTYAKQIMKRFHIPTAASRTFEDFDDAVAYLRQQGSPIVIKADGLAAGKGVTVAETMEEAEEALAAALIRNTFGESGKKVIIEDYLCGEEMTVLAFVAGATVLPMILSQDHKPVFDGDRGPNTGGMGAYSPVPHLERRLPEIERRVLRPVAEGLTVEGTPFCGVLYAGLMITENGPKVIEFNVRFGDPEAQVILPQLENDLTEIFLAIANPLSKQRLDEIKLRWKSGASVCVIATAPGYPGPPTKGLSITIPENIPENTQIFHAGTMKRKGQLVTNGGRIFGVTAQGADIVEARKRAYALMEEVRFQGKHFRRDIADKALN